MHPLLVIAIPLVLVIVGMVLNSIPLGSKEGIVKERVSSWELEKLRSALSIGDSALPLGVALKISN